jgi:aryl-phospho-beta-D-glucosidase BglC (GH1 family)
MRVFVRSECIVLGLFCFFTLANAWLPSESKIRGVNLGGLFIVEPWMMGDEWNSMGCGGRNDEFQCVQALGQTAADAAFQRHWGSWVTQDDINQIKGLGLNTVRIPLGYWIHESLVQPGEFFPRGGFAYLEKVCDMASAAGLYIILVLHAAPGGQSPNQQFTGKAVNPVGFFNSGNYERAYQWLEWITNVRHTHPTFRNVGAIEIVNEPVPGNNDEKFSMWYNYYPTAWKRIRAAEDKLHVTSNNRLHIQMMDARWNNMGDPTQGLGGIDLSFALYDDHNYRAYDCPPDSENCFVPPERRDYLFHSCFEDLGGKSPVIVGEWSLATSHPDGDEFDINKPDAVSFYRKWFGAQIHSYEKQRGWIFWSWKVNWIGGRNEWRWGYQQAVQAGVIPRSDPTKANDPDVCENLKMVIVPNLNQSNAQDKSRPNEAVA